MSVSVLILLNISGLNWLLPSETVVFILPMIDVISLCIACYPDTRKRYFDMEEKAEEKLAAAKREEEKREANKNKLLEKREQPSKRLKRKRPKRPSSWPIRKRRQRPTSKPPPL